MAINLKDLAAGFIFVAIGAFFAGDAVLTLRMGSTLNMGPGYFPAVLGGLLIAFGLAIAASGLGRKREPFGPVSVRGFVLVMAAIVFFGFTVRGLGFVPALFGTVLMSSLASRQVSLKLALTVSVALTVFATAVFVGALGLPYPLLGRWLS